jgi:ribose 5-phosphate isomerase B
VAIGGDHTTVAFKAALRRFLEEELRSSVEDVGTHTEASVDYPDLAAAVARAVASGRCERGIVLDAAGIGSAMAANKIPGIRCALCHDLATTRNSRAHNDANLLALGTRVVNPGFARTLVRVFLTTPFEGGRHQRRVDKITKLETGR